MANFTFLTNEFFSEINVLEAGSENISSTIIKRVEPDSVDGSVIAASLIQPTVETSEVYRIRIQNQGQVDQDSTFIYNPSMVKESYYDSTNWLGVNAFHAARGESFSYPYIITKPRLVVKDYDIFSVAINNTDGTTLDFFKLDTTSLYFDKISTVNDIIDGGADSGKIFVIENTFYCLFAKIDAAGDLILKTSTDEGETWGPLSTLELCSYSDNLDKLDAGVAGGNLLVMGTYEINSSFHVTMQACSEDLGFSWITANDIFQVDQTSASNATANQLDNTKMGISLFRDPIEDQLLMAHRIIVYDHDTSTFRNRINYYKTQDCKFFDFLHSQRSEDNPANFTEDATAVFEPEICVGIGRDTRRIYGFSGYGGPDNWLDNHFGVRADNFRIADGGDTTTNYIYRGMSGLYKLGDFHKYADHFFITGESVFSDRTTVAILRLGEWSTISEDIEYDQGYFAWDTDPEASGWDSTSIGSPVVTMDFNELHIQTGASDALIYGMNDTTALDSIETALQWSSTTSGLQALNYANYRDSTTSLDLGSAGSRASIVWTRLPGWTKNLTSRIINVRVYIDNQDVLDTELSQIIMRLANGAAPAFEADHTVNSADLSVGWNKIGGVYPDAWVLGSLHDSSAVNRLKIRTDATSFDATPITLGDIKIDYWTEQGGFTAFEGVDQRLNQFETDMTSGFVFRTTLKIPHWVSGGTDTTATSVGIYSEVNNFATSNAYKPRFGLYFADDSFFLKIGNQGEPDTSTVSTFMAHNMAEEFHDFLIVGKDNNLKVWFKSELAKDWTNVIDIAVNDDAAAPSNSILTWGNNLIENTPKATDVTSIWKEFKFSSRSDGGLTDGFINPDDLLGYELSREPTLLEQNVEIIFDGGEALVDDNWTVVNKESEEVIRQGDKKNIFNDRPFLKWKSKTDTTADYVIFHRQNSFIAANTFVLKDVNFDYCHIQMQNQDTTSWWNLDFDTTVDFRTDGDPNKPKHNSIFITTDTTAVKYMRIYIPQQNTEDGYYEIGLIGVGERLELDDNPEFPLEETEEYSSYVIKSKAGEEFFETKEARIRTWGLKFNAIPYTFYQQLQGFVENNRFGQKPAFFMFNYDASNYEVFYVRPVSDLKGSKKVGNLRDLEITLEEVI